MWPIGLPAHRVGRERELAVLQAGVEALERGEGAAVWVEGEPGIGKSALVAEALAAANQPGWDVGRGMADKLTERLPLRVMQDCLQVRLSSPDPRRAHTADLLRSRTLGLLSDCDASVTGIEVLATLADELSGLMAYLVQALLAAGSYQEAARQANRALTVMTETWT